MKFMSSALIRIICFILAMGPHAKAVSPQSLDSELDTRTILAREYFLWEYSKLNSVPEFINKFASQASPGDQAKILKHLSKLKHLPKIEAIDNGISIGDADGSSALNIDLRSTTKGRFLINDQVFTFSPRLSLLDQAEILLDKLEHPRSKPSSLFSLLIPQAQAFVLAARAIISTAIAIVGVTTAGEVAKNVVQPMWDTAGWWICDSFSEKAVNARNPYICKDYRAEMKKLVKNAPAIEAVKNALDDGKSNEIYLPGRNEICPNKSPNKDKGSYYHGTVTLLKKDDKVNKEGLTYRIYANFEQGKLKNATVYHDDIVSGVMKSTAIGSFIVDDQSILTAISIPDKDVATAALKKEKVRGQKKGANPIVTQVEESLGIKINATADLKNQPELQAQQAFFQGLFKHLGTRLKDCAEKSLQNKSGSLPAADNSNVNKGKK